MQKCWLFLLWTLLHLHPATAVSEAGEAGCPPLDKDSMGICVEECGSSSDCESAGKVGHLCCSNGCGHVCTRPSGAQKSQKPLVIMAVLRDNVFSAVLEILPAPLSSSELRSVKILTLKYGDARRACAAFRILEGHKEVTSVEFDGAVPKCGEEL